MIRDTVLICCIVICCVLFYRMYILNQKINNLEERTSVIDNFSQSIFQFITQKEEARLKQEQEQENMAKNQAVNEVVYSNNQPLNSNSLTPIVEEETETDDHQYNINNTNSGEKISETFESKEILSEMVDQLKESVIQINNENLENELDQIQELKQELKQELSTQDNLFNLLSSTDLTSNNQDVKVLDIHIENKQELSSKKKEEELLKMSLSEIKALAKIKNISVMKSNKPKKKELLIQEILAV
jgi:hypothetical protein